MSQQINNNSLPNQNLLFGQNKDSQNNQDYQIESKFQNRQEQFTTEEDISKIKESTMSQERSLGKDTRNKIFLQKRLLKKTNIESNSSLLDSLTMPKDIYEKIASAEIQPSDFQKIINSFPKY